MATSPWQRLLLLLLHQWALSLPMHMASGMLYAPPTGSIWDPSCLRIGGRTHCIFMYSSGNSTVNGQHGGYPSGLLASADDGVHWRRAHRVPTCSRVRAGLIHLVDRSSAVTTKIPTIQDIAPVASV